MSEPLILYPNLAGYVTSPNAYGMSLDVLHDGNNINSTATSGAADDNTMLYVYLSDSISAPLFYVDRVIVTRHNMKQGDFVYPSGAGGIHIGPYIGANLQTVTNGSRVEVTGFDGASHSVFKFDQVQADSVIVFFDKTATSNQEKVAAEIIMTRPIVDLGQDMASYDQRWREKFKEIALGDGGIHRVIQLNSAGRNLRYEASCQFRYLTEAVVESLRSLKESGEPFLFQPESESRPQDVYLCHWTGQWAPKYSSSYKGAGWTVDMQVKEV